MAMLIHQYQKDDVKVYTYRMGLKYETLIKADGFNKGKAKTVESYPDAKLAEEGHKKWIGVVMGKQPQEEEQIEKEDKSTNGIEVNFDVPARLRITLDALVQVLIRYLDRNSIYVGTHENNAEILKLGTLHPHTFAGSCKYDLGTLEAFDISSSWRYIIETTRVEAIDNKEAKATRGELVLEP